jgi:hypothetical protein
VGAVQRSNEVFDLFEVDDAAGEVGVGGPYRKRPEPPVQAISAVQAPPILDALGRSRSDRPFVGELPTLLGERGFSVRALGSGSASQTLTSPTLCAR